MTSNTKSLAVAWTALVLGGLLDIFGSGLMTNARGFKDVKSAVGAYAVVLLTTTLAIVSLDRIDLSVGWAVMAAVEVLGASAAGVLVFKESLTVTKLVGLVVTLAGVMVLSLTEGDGDGWRPWPESWDAPLWTPAGDDEAGDDIGGASSDISSKALDSTESTLDSLEERGDDTGW